LKPRSGMSSISSAPQACQSSRRRRRRRSGSPCSSGLTALAPTQASGMPRRDSGRRWRAAAGELSHKINQGYNDPFA
jgi:hypothetical protein